MSREGQSTETESPRAGHQKSFGNNVNVLKIGLWQWLYDSVNLLVIIKGSSKNG